MVCRRLKALLWSQLQREPRLRASRTSTPRASSVLVSSTRMNLQKLLVIRLRSWKVEADANILKEEEHLAERKAWRWRKSSVKE